MNTLPTPEFSFSLLTYDIEVGKTYSRRPDGSIKKDTDGDGFRGQFATYTLSSMSDLWALQERMTPRQCLIAGTSYYGDEWGTLGGGAHDHQRTKTCFPEPDGHALTTLDIDLEHCPFPLPTAWDVKAMLVWLVPQLASAALIVRPSSSAGVEGRPGGWHVHVIAPPGGRVEVMDRLSSEFARRGVAWVQVSDFPQLLERTPVDRALRIPNQPIYSGKPRVMEGVVWDRPEGLVQEGCAFDPNWLPPVSDTSEIFARLKAIPEVQQRRAAVIERKAEARVPAGTKDRPKALQRALIKIEQELKQAEKGELPPDFEIQIHNGPRVTVAEILKGGMTYHFAKTLTPGEEGYRDGAQTGIIYMDGSPRLHTQAHGGITYRLLGGEDPKPPKFDMAAFLFGFNIYHAKTQEVTLQEGRQRVTKAVYDFFRDLPNCLALRGTPGTGKSHASLDAVAAFRELNILYAVPHHKLSDELLTSLEQRGVSDAVIRRGRNDANCEDHEAMVRYQTRVGPNVNTGRDFCSKCPHRTGCRYFFELEMASDARVVIMSHEFLFTDHGIPGWKPDLIIVDETVSGFGFSAHSVSWVGNPLRPWSTDDQIMEEFARIEVEKGVLAARTNLSLEHAEALGALEWRTEIAQALLRDERSRVSYSEHADKMTFYSPRERLYKDTPTLFVDGTARQELIDLTAGRFGAFKKPKEAATGDLFTQAVAPEQRVHMERIIVQRRGSATQISGRSFTKAGYYKDKIDQIKKYTDRLPDSTAVIAPQIAIEALGWKDRPRAGHHGAVVGLNAMKDCEELVVFSPLESPVDSVLGFARFISHELGIEPPSGLWRVMDVPVLLGDGSFAMRKLKTFDHPIADAIYRHHTLDWAEQACDRNRRVSADHNLIYLGNDPLPIPMDSDVAWKDAVAGRHGSKIQEALDTGVVAKSPKSAHKVRPDIWPSEIASRYRGDYKAELEAMRDELEEDKVFLDGHQRALEVLRRSRN